MDDRIGEACGVFGVYAPGQPVAKATYFGLYALQHRGQESAGIAVSDGQTVTVVKDMGLVTQVFDERRLAPLDGHLAIGHVRYSTTGSSSWRNAQPVYRSVGEAGFALGHNGNLTNTPELADQLGMLPGLTLDKDGDSTSDSDLMAELLARAYGAEPRSDGRDLELALARVLPQLEGAFSLVLMDEAHLIGVRDPHGFRPLVLGRTGRGWLRACVRDTLRRRPREAPAPRAPAHPLQPTATTPGRAAEAQAVAREEPEQASGRGRRLDRARHRHATGRREAARGRGHRGALPG